MLVNLLRLRWELSGRLVASCQRGTWFLPCRWWPQAVCRQWWVSPELLLRPGSPLRPSQALPQLDSAGTLFLLWISVGAQQRAGFLQGIEQNAWQILKFCREEDHLLFFMCLNFWWKCEAVEENHTKTQNDVEASRLRLVRYFVINSIWKVT